MSIFNKIFKKNKRAEPSQNTTETDNVIKKSKQKPISLSIPPSIHPIGIFNKDDADKSFYLGREHQISKLVNILTNSPKHSSTLVTGHRGAGKTSFVYECIRRSKSLSIIRYMQEPRSIRIATFVIATVVVLLSTYISMNVAENFENLPVWSIPLAVLFSIYVNYIVVIFANRSSAIFNVEPSTLNSYSKNNARFKNIDLFIRFIIFMLLLIIGFLAIPALNTKTANFNATSSGQFNIVVFIIVVILYFELISSLLQYAFAKSRYKRNKKNKDTDNNLRTIKLYFLKILTLPKPYIFFSIIVAVFYYYYFQVNPTEKITNTDISTKVIFSIILLTFIMCSYVILRDYTHIFHKQFNSFQPLDQSFITRARKSLFYGYLRFWTPTLVVHINLGFNDISHKAVINALVTGLRHEYKSTFLSKLRLRFWVFLLVPISLSLLVAKHGEDWYGERIMKSSEHLIYQVHYNERAVEQINSLLTHDQSRFKTKLSELKNDEMTKIQNGDTDQARKSLLKHNNLIRDVKAICTTLGYQDQAKDSEGKVCALKSGLTKSSKLISPTPNDKAGSQDQQKKNNASPSLSTISTGFYDYKDFLGKRALLIAAINEAQLSEQQDSESFTHNKDHDNSLLNDFLMIEVNFLYDHNHKTWPKSPSKILENSQFSVLRGELYAHRTMAYPTFLIVSLIFFYYLFLNFSPYTRVYKKIVELNDRLNASVQSEHGGTLQPQKSLLGGFLSSLTLKNVHTYSPMDSKSVEILFTNLLKEMSEFRFYSSFLPKPKVVFVLDELDKLGSKLDREKEENDPAHRDSLNPGVTKREANVEHLLAEMKNILSSGAASFICIGGRELQDKWLADQTERIPLLTSVFDRCIYIPNMLIAHNSQASPNLELGKVSDPVGQMLYAVLCGSIIKWNELHNISKMSLRETSDLQTINQEIYDKLLEFRENNRNTKEQDNSPSSIAKHIVDELVDFRGQFSNFEEVENKDLKIKTTQLIRFLSYRSLGNPKKFHELVASFISSQPNRPHLHVLKLTDELMMNIQLLSGVFSSLENTFGKDMQMREDKVLTAIFYLADFLFKFHKRAFSWDSLEKIDELADIHRAPDIHQVLKIIVKSFEDIFLHPVFNGLYSYKFRREVANEIRFISKSSESAMASFNFTLDESLPLRTLYIEKLKMSKQESGKGDPDIIASLGELYEFDELYDSARKEYNRAIQQIDVSILPQLSEGVSSSATDIITKVLSCKDVYFPMISSWIFARLKLMMQVGMTYEQSGNLDRAFHTYSEAKAFADLAINAFFFTQDRIALGGNAFLFNRAPLAGKYIEFNEATSRSQNIINRVNSRLNRPKLSIPNNNYDFPEIESDNILEHFDLLFQPLFAKAWVQEKMVMAVHSSGDYLEKVLDSFRHILQGKDKKKTNNGDQQHQLNKSIRYLGAELRNRAGDLLFLKGKSISENDAKKTHLMEAINHYKEALEISLSKIPKDIFGNDFYEYSFGLPRFNSALIIKNALDYGEAILATQSIKTISSTNFFNNSNIHWPEKKEEINSKLNTTYYTNLDNEFEVYLANSHLAISMLVQAGYRETAASENIQVAHLLLHLIMFVNIKNVCKSPSNEEKAKQKENTLNILQLAGKQIRRTWDITPYLDKTHKTRRSVSRYFLDLVRESCCYLILADESSKEDTNTIIKQEDDYQKIAAKLKVYAVQIKYIKEDAELIDYIDFLKYVINFNRYPVLFRLQTVTMTLISQLTSNSKLDKDEFNNSIEELEQWQRSYDSTILFPSANVGIVQFLLLEHFKKTIKDDDKRRLKRKIQDNIQQTISTYKMGSEYYTMIEDMYYLYDDFNDRKMHFQFALMMLSDDLFEDILNNLE